MIKRLIGLLLAATCFLSIGSGVYAQDLKNDKVIPYPIGYDTTTAGASSYEGKANVKNSPYYTALDFYNMKSTSTLTLLCNFKTYQQTTETSCGPASALMVLYHFGNEKYKELEMAQIMDTNKDRNYSNKTNPGVADEPGEIGTSTSQMAHFFESIGWKVRSSLTEAKADGKTFEHSEDFRTFVIEQLKNNTPIMVENVDWGGHWRVIIGYDTMGTDIISDDVIIMADPYDTTDQMQEGYSVNSAERFYYMWFDDEVLPSTQKYQQWLLATPPENK